MQTQATKKEVPFWLEVVTVLSLGMVFGTMLALGILGMSLTEYLLQFTK